MRPVPKFSGIADSQPPHALGVIDNRKRIWVDIVKPMSSPEMGL